MQTNAAGRIGEVLLCALCIALALATTGYHYGLVNQTDLLPAIEHLIDRSVLSQDAAASSYPFYSRGIVWAIAQIGRVVPLPALLFGMHILSLVLLIYAVRKVASSLAPGAGMVGWMAVLLLILIRPPGANFVLGGFDVFEPNFYGYTLGYAVMLLALASLAEQRPVRAGVLAGIGFYVHVNTGVIGLVIAGGSLLFAHRSSRERLATLGKLLVTSLLIASPVIVLTLLHEILRAGGAQSAVAAGVRYFDVALFRNPHHLDPRTWPLLDQLEFLALGVVLGLLIRKHRLEPQAEHDRLWGAAAVWVMILCLLGYVNVFLRSEIIAKAYLFKSSAVLKVIAFCYFAWAIWRDVDARRRERWARYAVGLLVLAAIAGLVLNVAVARSPRLAGSPLNRVCRGIELTLRPTPLEDWIHRQTPRDAVFLVPPDYEEFAVRTQRAPVATWKRDIYRRGGWSEWYQRIVDASGGSVTLESTRGAGSSNAVSAMVARAYERLPDEVVTALARNYGAQYCIMREGGATPTRRFEVVQRWQDLVVYRLAGMAE